VGRDGGQELAGQSAGRDVCGLEGGPGRVDLIANRANRDALYEIAESHILESFSCLCRAVVHHSYLNRFFLSASAG
jgi:hypothetical protein